jgi:hypothetical protein
MTGIFVRHNEPYSVEAFGTGCGACSSVADAREGRMTGLARRSIWVAVGTVLMTVAAGSAKAADYYGGAGYAGGGTGVVQDGFAVEHYGWSGHGYPIYGYGGYIGPYYRVVCYGEPYDCGYSGRVRVHHYYTRQ